ncbi:MAG: EthD family reductase [Pseudonocardia sp.]|nr:EthD family reductase [Pseudonocardia sp.]
MPGGPVRQLTVLYNHPEDPAAFDKHYREVHAPLAAKAPGLASYTVNWCAPGPDGSKPPYHLIAVLTWETEEAMQASMSSDEFKAAGDDLPNFAAAGATLIFGKTDRIV